ncbi:MAG: DUF58 domain-containing protein [Treponema sp.]|nr:DUF58 domain-containing protein [Treponema sp.]
MDDKSSLSKKASLLKLNALSLADGMRSGAFRSLYRGQGLDFDGVREYLRGDDVRAIDWNVTARMGKPFVKVFEEERELDVFIVLDTSLSMRFSSKGHSRMNLALDCAKLLTLASLRNASPVGAVVFDSQIVFSLAPEQGKDHAMLLLSKFESLSADGSRQYKASSPGSYMENAINGAMKLLKKRTLVMIFSDFRMQGYFRSFGQLCQKNDVVAARICDPLDQALPSAGTLLFSDMEGCRRSYLPTSSRSFKSAWLADRQQSLALWKRECLSRGGVPLVMSTDKDSFSQLQAFFSARKGT